VLALSSLSRDLVGVGTRSTPREPPDVVRFSLRAPQTTTRLTNVNEDVLGTMRLADVEEVSYGSSGGARIQGWLVKPPGFDRTRRYPLIMEIHGGPHGMYGVGFSYQFQNFAANGYLVLYVNRAAARATAATSATRSERAYPGVDYDDLMAGVDEVVGAGTSTPTGCMFGGCTAAACSRAG